MPDDEPTHDDDASDGDAALPPEAMWALIEAQQRAMTRSVEAAIPWFYGVWGGAWLVGFLVLWLSWTSASTGVTVPGPLAGTIFAVLIVSATVASTVVAVRLNRGVRGASEFTGTVYGVSWAVLGVGFGALGSALVAGGMTSELATLYFPSAYAVMTGGQYLAGAAIWRSTGQLVLGALMVATGAVTPFLGAPGNLLGMAFIGGGSLLTAGIASALRLRSRR